VRETRYQTHVIKELQKRFPGCVVLKNDSSYLQGVPDLTMLYYDGFWGTLETKISINAPRRPNQEHYVALMREMSFSAFIYPEIEEEVLDAFQYAFEFKRNARLP
jgi:hypothetical protein